ncbi:diacylglycerol/lipid kinase family protein [Actinokineospora xionganensis]|uniref:YegS/Rv2252/BmrU family lipid kinase n=1 Tax=Actinokineospora xionganensis TaxID=2684470 RepID=A0ABR7LD97_9PSEU|nr:YegS/Rv2252/BmrU family lipid kinase [Actinokineospora xionganensis]MBC6450635.1 YegS/Rv2252/BmrU family lipid kinase [Actinokineospora xionganensis]
MGIRAALAVHPASGHGAAGRACSAVAEKLRSVVDHLTMVEANSVAESRALMVRARDAGLDLLVVLGGDGSAHQGVQFCAEHDVPLAVVPAGTGNDLVRALGFPMESLSAADALVEAIGAGRRRRIDLGRVGDEWFASVLCAGFDSAVNERVNRMRWPHGPRRYDLAILAELAALRPKPLVLDTEDGRVELEATLVAVGNTAYYGGGIPVCPDADPADGLLDVTIVGKASRLDLIRILPSLRTGKHVAHPAVRILRARRVSVGGDNGWVAYADGERIGPLPRAVECVPGALEIVG